MLPPKQGLLGVLNSRHGETKSSDRRLASDPVQFRAIALARTVIRWLLTQMDYLVTTRKEVIPSDRIVVMVDGTVPGWKPYDGDFHYDHHSPDGSAIQIEEMEEAPCFIWGLNSPNPNLHIVTTQVDADACVAAAWLLLSTANRETNYRKLAAIAYDCDHLTVPPELSDLADFAAQAVAALKSNSGEIVKQLNLNPDRKTWTVEDKEAYSSEAFKQGTEWLIAACRGERSWPGERGEAKQYWESVEANTQTIINQNRVTVYRDCFLFDGKGLQGKYIDPRCWLKAAQQMGLESPLAITLVQREVIIENEFKGYSYTIGCVPLHPALSELDYTKGTFDSLTAKEKELNPNADGWGGRKTVGGSGWNTPSQLNPEHVIDTVLSAKKSALSAGVL